MFTRPGIPLPASLLLLAMSFLNAFAAMEINPPPEAVPMTSRQKAAAIAAYERLSANTAPVTIGDPEELLVQRLGEPSGRMTVGGRQRLTYEDGFAIIEDGKVAGLEGFPQERLRAASPEAYDALQEAHGRVRYNGKWMTPEEAQAAYERALADRDRNLDRVAKGRAEMQDRARRIEESVQPYLDIRNRGVRISKDELVVPGKVTVVDFYADWCAPCRQISPYLAKLAEHPDVVVRKVDIVSWRSPVARQWQLRSIPNMRVFDRNGEPVGQPTHDLRVLIQNIEEVL